MIGKAIRQVTLPPPLKPTVHRQTDMTSMSVTLPLPLKLTGHRQTDMTSMSVTLPLAMALATPKKKQDIEARKQASKHKSCPPSSLPSNGID